MCQVWTKLSHWERNELWGILHITILWLHVWCTKWFKVTACPLPMNISIIQVLSYMNQKDRKYAQEKWNLRDKWTTIGHMLCRALKILWKTNLTDISKLNSHFQSKMCSLPLFFCMTVNCSFLIVISCNKFIIKKHMCTYFTKSTKTSPSVK